MTLTKLPETLTEEKVGVLRDAFGYFYDEGKTSNFKDSKTGIRFKNSAELIDELWGLGIPKETSIKHIGITLENWYENISKSPEYSEPTMAGAPESEVQANIPQKGIREVQEQERLQRENAINAADEKGRQQTLELIERLKKRKVTVIPKEQIRTITLSAQEKEEAYSLGKAALIDPHTTQQTIEAKINEAIKNSSEEVAKTIPQETISNCATDFTEKISIFGNFTSASEIPDNIESLNETSTLTALTNIDDEKLKKIIPDQKEREIVAKDAQDISLAIELNRNVNTSLLKPILGSTSIAELTYGPENVTQYQTLDGTEDLTEEQKKEEKEIDIGDLYDNASDIRDFWEKFSSGKVSVSEAVGDGSKLLPTYSNYANPYLSSSASSLIAGSLLVIGTFTGFSMSFPMLTGPSAFGILTSGTGGAVLSESAHVASSSLVIGSSFNFSAGSFGLNILTGSKGATDFYAAQATFGGKALNLLAVKTGSSVTLGFGTSLAGGVGTAAETTAITTAAGTATSAIVGQVTIPIPLVGAAIGFIVGLVGPKAIGWLKDHAKDVAGFAFAGVGAVFGGFLGAMGTIGALGGGIIGTGLGYGVGSLLTGGIPAVQSSISSFASGAGAATSFIWTTFMAGVGMPILVTFLAFPVVVALILFIINSGAYVVPPGSLDSAFTGIGTEGGIPIKCTEEKDSTGIKYSVNSPIATRALHITEDLYQGFWCFWNRSPKAPAKYFPKDVLTYPPGYPQLFDYERFKRDPNPKNENGLNLFWCTWLVVKAYQESGNMIGLNLYSPNMFNDFNSRGKIIDAGKATPNNIIPGSVVFFHITTGPNRLNHVAIVYSVDAGGITIVESNAPLKNQTINFKPSGGTGNLPLMEVKYFGLP